MILGPWFSIHVLYSLQLVLNACSIATPSHFLCLHTFNVYFIFNFILNIYSNSFLNGFLHFNCVGLKKARRGNNSLHNLMNGLFKNFKMQSKNTKIVQKHATEFQYFVYSIQLYRLFYQPKVHAFIKWTKPVHQNIYNGIKTICQIKYITKTLTFPYRS